MALKRSKHNLSHYVLQSQTMGKLVPCGLVEILPGDTIQHHLNTLMRLPPLNTPVMHPVHVTQHCWFVPARLLMDDWEKFITGGEDGEDNTVYPTIAAPTTTGFPIGSLGDYLGLPVGQDGFSVSALPFRAYNMIYNHFYRDEQLQTPRVVSKASGADTTTTTTLASVNWGKDYFTAARPEPQLGPDVYLPLGTSAPVKGLGSYGGTAAALAAQSNVRETGGGTVNYAAQVPTSIANYIAVQMTGTTTANGVPNIRADLTEATALTINDLRRTSALQRFYERMNRSGARYDEYLMGLGVKSSDARLQLPEYLGGVSQTVQFSEVLGTVVNEDTQLGQLGGHGIAAVGSGRYTRFFEEHGFLMCLMYVRPVTMYTQGVNRMWNRRTKFDFWQRELQHIGDQEVLNKELYVGATGNDDIFGFSPRYDEYRTVPSRVAGEMRDTLDTWHMARIFGSRPALNSDFITANPTDRIFPVDEQNADNLYVYMKHHISMRRLVAKRATSFLS